MGKTVRFRTATIALACLAAMASCSHSKSRLSERASTRKGPGLVLISIDGLRPDFYVNPEYRKAAPTLARMSDEGERAPRGIEPVFPSLTYPDHVSMVTGAYPDRHGVYSNQVFSRKLGLLDDWYFYANEIQVPTLWRKAEDAGLKVALIRWPASAGANVDWIFPEIFYPGAFDIPRDWTLIRQYTEPRSFLKEIIDAGPVKKPAVLQDLDQMAAQAFESLMDHQSPDLVLIHLVSLDFAQHRFGTDSPEVTKAVAGIDAILARMLSRIDPSRTTVIVTGDHGFATYRNMIYIAPLIRAAGVEDRVVALADGGQTAIFQQPGGLRAGPGDCRKILLAAREYGPILHLITRRKLNDLHAYPGAICAFEAKLGYAISAKASEKVLSPVNPPRGHHGYLPSRPEMRAGFFIWGKAVSEHGRGDPAASAPHVLEGDADGQFHMPDIAPTAASILGIPFDAPDGSGIRF